jgi:hypothetical protein
MAAGKNFEASRGQEGERMVDGTVFVIMGVWFLLIGLEKARVSKNPEATVAWLKKWGIVLLCSLWRPRRACEWLRT